MHSVSESDIESDSFNSEDFYLDNVLDKLGIHKGVTKANQVEKSGWQQAWFKVSVSAADSAGTETDRSRRLGSDSDDTRKTLHRTPKKL